VVEEIKKSRRGGKEGGFDDCPDKKKRRTKTRIPKKRRGEKTDCKGERRG